MSANAENVTQWFRRKPSNVTGSGFHLAAFGKHPGWDDHIPGIGVDTEALAGLKQSLYFDGIRSQIDSGAWEKMEQSRRLEGFNHTFLWLRPGAVLLGLMWSSSDRIGRAKYPMIVCAEGDGISPAFMFAHGNPELERLRDTCKALTSAEEVTMECRMGLDRLRGIFERAQGGWTEPFSDILERQRFLNGSEMGPDGVGFLRILHEYSTEQGTQKSARHLRVPIVGGLPADAFTPWVEFFKSLVPSKTPVLFIKRNGANWLDVVIGEPTSHDFFCLQASIDALPLTTQVPYDISRATHSVLETVTARMGVPVSRTQTRPSTQRSAKVEPEISTSSQGRGWPLVLLGIIVLIVMAAVALLLFLRSSSPAPKPGPASVNQTAAQTAAAMPVAAAGVRYDTAMQAATDAFSKGDYNEAIRQADLALEAEPGDATALQIKSDAIAKNKDAHAQAQSYAAAMAAAHQAFASGNYDEAVRQIKIALEIKPGDSAAMTLGATAEARRDANTSGRQNQYDTAMARGRAALTDKNYDEAVREAETALTFEAGDGQARDLMTQALNAKKAAQDLQKYETAMEAGRQALNAKKYGVAAEYAAEALVARPADAAAVALRVAATPGSNAQPNNPQYQTEIAALQAAWNKNDFDAVIQHASRALQLAPNGGDVKSKLQESVYNKLEIYAVWFGVIKPQDATSSLAKAQSPLPQGDMAPNVANAYKAQIDSWLRMLHHYQLIDDAHTKLAAAIEQNINRY